MAKNRWLMPVICMVVVTCAPLREVSDNPPGPMSFWINEEHIDEQEGLRVSLVRTFAKPYLGIAVNDTAIAAQLSDSKSVQVILARGSRPVTVAQESLETPYRLGFDATRLFEKAIPGDRLIFGSADRVFYSLPLI